MIANVRSSVSNATRGLVALAVLVAFALATLGARPDLASGRSGALIAAVTAARTAVDVCELASAKATKLRSGADAIKRNPERIGAADEFDPALLVALHAHDVGPPEVVAIIGGPASSSGWRQRFSSHQHRSRAPPPFV